MKSTLGQTPVHTTHFPGLGVGSAEEEHRAFQPRESHMERLEPREGQEGGAECESAGRSRGRQDQNDGASPEGPSSSKTTVFCTPLGASRALEKGNREEEGRRQRQGEERLSR